MAEIVFEGVSKRYSDGHEAVRNLDLAIDDGEFLVLVGPSGCGKSTALRMVAGLEDITGGRIFIGDAVANDLAPRERNIAMVFQSYALYPHLTVAENIGFGLRVRGVARAEIDEKVKATAAILELDDYLARKPAQLSGGQRQRVAMGRAIIREPQAFLMDEPLSNLDARLRVQMRAEIARIQKMTGVTTIYVTHDQVEAMTMGHRVAVMNRGVLQQFAPPRILYHEPANVFVASFIGSPSMNLMEATVVGGAVGPALMLGADRIELPDDFVAKRAAMSRYAGKTVAVGIRPEALTVGHAGEPAPGTVMGTVAFTEDLGASILVHLDIDAPPPRIDVGTIGTDDDIGELARKPGSCRIRASVDGFTSVKEGDRLPIAIDLERAHLFDEKTGAAIRA